IRDQRSEIKDQRSAIPFGGRMEISTPKIIRKPVKEADAEQYLLTMLLSFAGTVIVVRAYLKLTGFPQVGGGDLHIAHLLWGGLLLFIGTLLPLMMANRWIRRVTAVLSGVGVGLFIDEVGKFITKSNDYFYPAAAPIIYAVFLVTVLLYLQVRRAKASDPRSELYHALDDLTEAIDHDLDAREKSDVETRLLRVTTATSSPDQVRLARELLDFIQSPELRIVTPLPPFYAPWLKKAKAIEDRLSTRPLHKTIIVSGLGIFGVLALTNLLPILSALASTSSLEQMTAQLVRAGVINSANELLWYLARLTMEGAVGALLILADGLMLVRREERGTTLGAFGLLLYLLSVNLLILYFDQYTIFVVTVLQFGLFLAVIRYRRRFLGKRGSALALPNVFQNEAHVVNS
ncbi:MAG TPA: hypothetical protein VII92_00080, partial [Anaerolineae bacterium]